MRNIKITIEYEGTNYCGWQIQPNKPTVQEELIKAINKITGENVNLIGAGRTDSGVHATGQVANFRTISNIPGRKFASAITSQLPYDIAVKQSEEVPLDFHARFDAKGKRYKYIIVNQSIRSPLLRNFAYYIPYKLDLDLMNKGKDYLLGSHDFGTFMSSGSSIKDTVRTINFVSINEHDNLIIFKIEGNGFLYNMVRIIVGTLVDIGRERIYVNNLPNIIESKDRTNAGHTAPAQGLYLEKVFY